MPDMEAITIRMPKMVVECIGDAVESGMYANKSEFIREAAREKLHWQFGMIKKDVDWRLTKEQKDEVAREILQELGLEKKYPLK